VTDDHVHYYILGDAATEQFEAVKDFLNKQFGHALVYMSPINGSCASPDAFATEFEYVRERERESYES
jgi:hypothetical protein